ncbi:DUF2846 domain-containing protein [Pseudomonas sp. No.21]|uniref:DUF2846 domain-containing protein n=1 Tax=Pseudomonas TaxID=286 RepID=UPI000DAA92EC|nr:MULTISPECIES: DUF2846 domain-containing protein [Pseudomonas]MDU9414071.1 DUF2846 domain-containing protein [Pseudomonas sp. zfem005]MDW3710591.1 DUF2846 domain-containing protein [Pseudomonas sp. 2023EL-01195]PZE10187.1 hypothetical protein DMX10_27325 [Pseudomonas sp. 57B-090624]UXY51425.1 DUF2846 domain-containing protein [Pseudomonas tohonis]BBP84660.1 hypothetical protein PHLH8_43020 [Pseudomonas sp. Pc102]
MTKIMMCTAALAVALLSGCASVPMESPEKDAALKAFPNPPQDQSAVYIFRDTSLGAALKKTVKIDDKVIGETAPNTYFYRLITPGAHVLSTESEFGDNTLNLSAQPGKNHYVRQSIRIGVFAGGATLSEVSESEGKKAVADTKLAR